MPQPPATFLAKLKKYDRRLSVRYERGAWRLYRGGKYTEMKTQRLDDAFLHRMHDQDAWRHPDIIKKIDEHNEAIEERSDRGIERASNALADKLTQRHY